ncbi:MAG TPA: hypothetical protein VGO73_13030 [Pyrinomonadaceae bacterium]|nr:hypothetical protein [Pyrinomonadaceae bacterium]
MVSATEGGTAGAGGPEVVGGVATLGLGPAKGVDCGSGTGAGTGGGVPEVVGGVVTLGDGPAKGVDCGAGVAGGDALG